MFRISHRSLWFTTACLLLPLAACTRPTPTEPASPTATEQEDRAHVHREPGPHGGHLMELGDGQYHAEWTHDDETKTITVYFLDSDAKEEVVPDPGSATIEVVMEGQEPTTYALDPQLDIETDEGRYVSTESSLFTALQMVGHGVQATLRVSIGRQSFKAEFEHHHDHDDDHGHAH